MRAMVIDQYGGPEQLTPMELPTPSAGPGELLIRVAAAGVNPFDWKRRAGYLAAYLPAAFPLVLGADVAGTVEAVGEDVTGFAPGDAVYGMVLGANGSYAEYVAATAAAVAYKPTSLDFIHAAAVPLAASAARAAVVDALQVGAGETVLIGGAAGAVGAAATQLAIGRGAHVIGVASARDLDYVRTLGAQETIDYTTQDVAAAVRAAHPDGVDAFVDVMGGETLLRAAAAVRDAGRIATLVPDEPTVAQLQGRGFTAQGVAAAPSAASLAELARMIDDGRFTVRVAEVLPLAEAARAHRLVERGHTRGKVVLTIG